MPKTWGWPQGSQVVVVIMVQQEGCAHEEEC